jgi:DNA polymerase III subunit epsilon
MRQIVLDTETTGLEPSQGHRIIEIGCVELVDRKLTGRHYHQYIQPQRLVDEGAMEVHGITDEFLKDKPLFGQIVDEFMAFVKGAELVIHNAPFDIGFLDHELRLDGGRFGVMDDHCSVIDTLVMARQKHPGQKNNLDALCKRYMVDNSQRDLHGALLDAEILADVYLMMTGGQRDLMLGQEEAEGGGEGEVSAIRRLAADRQPLRVVMASDEELAVHQRKLDEVQKASGDCIWLKSPS